MRQPWPVCRQVQRLVTRQAYRHVYIAGSCRSHGLRHRQCAYSLSINMCLFVRRVYKHARVNNASWAMPRHIMPHPCVMQVMSRTLPCYIEYMVYP